MRAATTGSSSSPSIDILSILKDVKNITVAFRDYSHLAGDLNSCVEIIEMLTNYTKHHRNDIGFNDEEAKVNNVFFYNNSIDLSCDWLY